jgi:hypothetical protein
LRREARSPSRRGAITPIEKEARIQSATAA